jgi:hypothetical protein
MKSRSLIHDSTVLYGHYLIRVKDDRIVAAFGANQIK